MLFISSAFFCIADMVTPVQIEALLPYPYFVHYFHIRKKHGPAWIVNSIRFHLLNRV